MDKAVLERPELTFSPENGCATELAVQAAVRDALDRDLTAIVVSDACATANDEDHEISLPILGKIASVCTVSEL
jgi:nicotinamidase-related amidase